MSAKNLKITGFYESRAGRYYVTEDRIWKVRLESDNEAVAIRENHEMYRLAGNTTYNVRERRTVSPGGTVHQDVVALVAQVRSIESQ